jgi:outer membrane protein
MKVVKTTVMVVALTLALSAGPAFAQATAPAQNPPAQQPPATDKPTPQPAKPFPEGAKVGFVDLQVIASTSAEGKAASAKLEQYRTKANAQLTEKTKEAQAVQQKLQQGGTVLSEQARLQAEKDFQRLQRELQAMQEDANTELQQMTVQLQSDFQERLNPIIEQIATEKGLHVVFSVRDSGIVWADAGIDLSAEVIKRFDAAPTTTPKK